MPITTDLKKGNLDTKDATNQMGYIIITVIVCLPRKLCREQRAMNSPRPQASPSVHGPLFTGIISSGTIL